MIGSLVLLHVTAGISILLQKLLYHLSKQCRPLSEICFIHNLPCVHVGSALYVKEFLAIRRAISLYIRRSFYFVEITTGDTRHTQQIHKDEPSMYPCPLVRIFKTGFPKCM